MVHVGRPVQMRGCTPKWSLMTPRPDCLSCYSTEYLQVTQGSDRAFRELSEARYLFSKRLAQKAHQLPACQVRNKPGSKLRLQNVGVMGYMSAFLSSYEQPINDCVFKDVD